MSLRQELWLVLLLLVPFAVNAAPEGGEKYASRCAVSLQPTTTNTLWLAKATIRCDSTYRALPAGTRLLMGLTLAPAPLPYDYDENWERYERDLPPHVFTLNAGAVTAEITFQTPLRFVPERMTAIVAVWPIGAFQPCSSGRDGCRKFGFALGCGPDADDADRAGCEQLDVWRFSAATGLPQSSEQ